MRSPKPAWWRGAPSAANSFVVLLGVVAITAAPAIAAPLSGTYSSPLGAIAVSEKDGAVIGKIVDAKKNACGFAKGHTVLEGSRLDDSLVGTLRACKVGDGCSGPIEGDAMLLITRGGAVMSGAVHLTAGTCKTPLAGDSVVFKKGAAATTKTPGNPTTSGTDKKESPRVRAERLTKEAFKQFESDGNAEALRAKCQEAVQIDATYAEGHVCVGVSFYTRQRYDEALENYKKALEANPSIGDAYYNMGCVYALKGDKEQALRYLRIALLNGYIQLESMTQDEDLKSLAGDPLFEKLKQGITD